MNQRLMVGSLAVCLAAGALSCGPTQKEVESGKADAPAPSTPCPAGQVQKDTQCIPSPAASAPLGGLLPLAAAVIALTALGVGTRDLMKRLRPI